MIKKIIPHPASRVSNPSALSPKPSSRVSNPSALSPKPSSFVWPQSVQSDLFNYLKPQQQAIIRPYLRLIKRPYQEKLCISLMDYLEGNGLNPISQPVLRFLQNQIIEECGIHPLTSSKGLGFRDQGLGKNSLNPQL